jgi:DNA-binding NarL/FixJ family response regulator
MEQVLRVITVRRAEVLRRVAEQRTQSEIAKDLHLSEHGVKSHITWLKDATATDSMRSLGRWWMQHREEWVDFLADIAGSRRNRTA